MPEERTSLPLQNESSPRIFSAAYFKEAAQSFKSVKMLAFASLIVAMRVAVKFVTVPLAAGLELSLDCYVNSLGAIVYGPLMGLLVGAVSDTLGCIIHPTGPYFFPFIFTEMLNESGCIFAENMIPFSSNILFKSFALKFFVPCVSISAVICPTPFFFS